MSKWIEAAEKPPAEKEVFAACKTEGGTRYRCIAFYVPEGMRREDSDYNWDWECCDEYDEEADDYYVNPGWYERIYNWDEYSAVYIDDTVTHWRPLTKLPMEN